MSVAQSIIMAWQMKNDLIDLFALILIAGLLLFAAPIIGSIPNPFAVVETAFSK